MNKKSIIFFDGTLLHGGAERVISIVTSELANDSLNKVSILLWYDEPDFYEIDPRVNVIKIPKVINSQCMIKKILWLRKYLSKEKGVMVSFLAPFNMIAIVSHFFLTYPIVVADRNDPRKIPKSRIFRFLRDFLYMFADIVVLQTERNSNYFKYIKADKKIIIPNPIAFKGKKGLALRTPKRKRIVSVGRLIEQKNNKLLMRAFAKIAKKYPYYTLSFYGDGELREQLKRLAYDLGIEKKVEFFGNVKKIHEEIADAEMFVLSSNFEGMPNALMEAMCLGLPVISTKVSGATELIEDKVNGLLVDINDVDGMEKSIEMLIDDSEYRKKMGQNATRIYDCVKSDIIVKKWVDCINRLP